ncbi:MAG: Threonine synthase [Candidatus Heimdallarchaeota archaeon LC_2]|nr:MAG: Threonine synthase [Candidatus Heimdallarchaeota archaeon LC_2]
MKFTSTRDKNIHYSISEALLQGLAPDGGLFVPEKFPQFNIDEFMEIGNLVDVAHKFLYPFFEDDILQKDLKSVCSNAFNFDLTMRILQNGTNILELFHGPTGAFKDFGARFLAQCFGKLKKKITILVATSGDTGSAVASAFHGVHPIEAIVLYPKDKISNFQEIQLTCWDDNITSIRVDGDFDSCQKLVKQAFSDKEFTNKFNLTSANSINIGRLLPQCVYYIFACIKFYQDNHEKASFIIPTGNMGNAMAAIWVKKMGFPIDKIILSCNENDVIVKYFQSGDFEPQPSKPTLANAMDVGNPSNLERFIDLKKMYSDEFDYIEAYSVTDEEIKQTIRKRFTENGELWCPHTATALRVQDQIINKQWIIVATAHPAKFKDIVDPLIGEVISYPPNLERFLSLSSNYTDMKADISVFMQIINNIDQGILMKKANRFPKNTKFEKKLGRDVDPKNSASFHKNDETDKPTGNFVKSFKFPTISEEGKIFLSNKFPFKPMKNLVLQTTNHMIERMREENVTMEYVSFIFNDKNQGFRSKDKTIVVSRIVKSQEFSYIVLNNSNNLVTIVKKTSTLPRYINLSRRLW